MTRCPGKKKIEINSLIYQYTGEIDADYKASGRGTAVHEGKFLTYTYKGTFVNDYPEGICKW